MTVSEKILAFVETTCKEQGKEQFSGLDVKTIAAELGIWPNNASVALNTLVRTGRLRAEGSRPVRYFPIDESPAAASASDDPPAFENIIGHDGSLRQQLELARVAASYPPHGIHTLIIGETGVGKSLLAEEIWHYIQQQNRQKNIPYVVFNCAEYAENPQLLLSQLFGYEKGAFTGADSAHAGLVEKADGGVLFLDELHRLPATGQELLFTLIDKKQFRRMGSTADRTVDLMIIGATTENPEKSFLKTFIRRIPILIQLPSLNERPLDERVNLVSLFLSREANRLGLAIRVSTEALKLMVSFQGETNIGELRNEIQLCCARSFLLYLSAPETSEEGIPFIRITNRCLSRKMNTNVSADVRSYISACSMKSFMIYPDHAPSKFSVHAPAAPLDFYRFVEEHISAYNASQHDTEEIAQLVALDLEKQYHNILQDQVYGAENEKESTIFGSVPADIWAAANELIRLATAEFNRTYPDNILRTLAIYLNQTKSYAKANQIIFDSSINMYLEPNHAEREFVRKTMPILNAVLGAELTDGEIGVLAMLLGQSDPASRAPRIGLIVCKYGNGTASGTAAFANEVLMTDFIFGIDLPLEQSIEISLKKLCSCIERQDQGLGVIVLTDNDILLTIEKSIQERVKAICRVLPWSSAAFTIEMAKAIQTYDYSLDMLIENTVLDYRKYLDSLFERVASHKSGPSGERLAQRDVIITYCLTGTGSARRVRELLLKSPPILTTTEIISMGIQDDILSAAKRYSGRLKLIIGLFSPQVPGVPFISMESIASPGGINRVLLLLQGWHTLTDEAQWNRHNLSLRSRFDQISQKMQYFAPSLDAKKVEQQALQVVDRLTALYQDKLTDDVLVRVFIHTAAMFERITASETIPVIEHKIPVEACYQRFFNQLHQILEDACQSFGYPVPLSEVYLFMMTVPNPETMEEIRLSWENNS